MKIDDKNREVLLSSMIGLEFEFYSKVPINKVRSQLAKLLRKKILVFDKVHSDFIPTSDTFKLEPDYSGGRKMVELITGPLTYIESKLVTIKVLDWIKENGETTERCSFQFNVSFDPKKYGYSFVTHMNVLKFILDFDEEEIYKHFPQRRNSVYAKSINFITPKSKFYIENDEDFKHISPDDFLLPATKYYGINFSKLTKGYLEFRYLGGRNYEHKREEILSIVDNTIILLYQSITEKGYSDSNYKKLGTIYSKHSRLIKAYKSHTKFVKHYPRIKLTVDLRTDKRVLEMYYPNLRDHLFEIMSESSLKIGEINYDSDTGKLQLKDAKLDPCYSLKDIDLVNCRIRGTVERCNIFACQLVDSEIIESNIFGETNLHYSKIKNSFMGKNVHAENSYFYGKNSVISGELNGGILREGKVTQEARISSTTEVVEFQKI